MEEERNILKENEDIKVSEVSEKKTVSLDTEECKRVRIASIKRKVEFTDYSVDPPEEIVFDVTFVPVPISERKNILKRCTRYDRAGIPEIDWERVDDILLCKTLGFSEEDWEAFKKNHPIGLYNKLLLASKEVNAELTLSKDMIEQLKNLGGQEQ